MRNLLYPILAVFGVFACLLVVIPVANADEVTTRLDKHAKDEVKVEKPSLTFYYIDQ
jgi:hypothetical protein